MNRRTLWVSILAGLALLPACSDPEPVPAPPPQEQPAPEAPPEPQEDERPAPMSAADVAFWFGPGGAPRDLGGPKDAPPVPPSARAGPYILAPGDVIDFRLLSDDKLDREATVGPDGTITLDLVGGLEAAGLTIEQLNAVVTQAYRKYMRNPRPVVSLKTARVDEVVVVGAVSKAGRLVLAGSRRLLDALADAGYGGETNQLRDRITVLRGGRVLSVWARDVLSLRDPRWNLILQPNDVVVIHLPEQAAVAGEVARPGPVVLPPRAGLSIVDALAAVGGVTQDADLQGARIVRSFGERIEAVDLNAVLFAGAPAPEPLLAGDTLTVPAGRPTKVFVFGMVEKPGLQRYAGRVSVVAALSHASPKQFGALLDSAKLVRGWPHDPEVISIDLDALLLDQQASLDLEMRDGDVLYIPESALSDVLDFLDRALSPLTRPASAASGFFSPQ